MKLEVFDTVSIGKLQGTMNDECGLLILNAIKIAVENPIYLKP